MTQSPFVAPKPNQGLQNRGVTKLSTHLGKDLVNGCYSFPHPILGPSRPLLETKVLLGHLATDGVVKVTVLLERLDGEIVVDLVQTLVERSDKLHATDSSEKVGHALVSAGILCTHSDLVVRRLELDVLAAYQVVDLA